MFTISASKPLRRNRCRITTELPPSPYVPMTSGRTSPIRTVDSATARPTERPVQGKERRVVRDDLDMAGWARRNGIDGIVHQRVLDARVAESHREVGAALTCGHHRMVHEVLEVDVPQPGEVLAVGY